MVLPDHTVGQKPDGDAIADTASAPTVIEVLDVAAATAALPEVPYKDAIECLLTRPSLYASLLKRTTARRRGHDAHDDFTSRFASLLKQTPVPTNPVEACSRYHGQLVANVDAHPVVAAIDLAFNDHRPLVLSPDIVWILVMQGFANHVRANAEDLRPQLVKHVGKIVIEVRRDDFIKGSPENPWPEIFDEFTDQIRHHVGEETHNLLLPTFTTTGLVERAAAQVVLLDAMESFLSYEIRSLCGIPQIVLEGTADDWEKLAQRTQELERFHLQWWTSVLIPILNEFIAATRGQVNRQFWQSIYKKNSRSGGPYTSGWITAFFPYLKDGETGQANYENPWLTCGGTEFEKLLFPDDVSDPRANWYAARNGDERTTGPKSDEFPGGLARAIFLWKHLNHSHQMEFLGGFVGVQQDTATLRLRPEIGWAVRQVTMTQK